MPTVTPHTEMMNDLLKLAVDSGVSDIIVKSNKPGYVRLAGKLKPVDMDPITNGEANAWVEEHTPKMFRAKWDDEGQVDFAYSFEGVGRFRVNAFHQRGLVSIVMRHIKSTVPSFDQLKLGDKQNALIKMAQAKDGILLVCGATGSGKSSTMAAMMNWINTNLDKHIVTIEDPIEYTFQDDKSLFQQREIGLDVPNFQLAIKAVLSGDDSLTLPFMAVGAEGVISVASNLYVREISQMVRAALGEDYVKARKIHRRLYPVFKTLFIEPNPVPIKVALVRAGIISSIEVRSPLCDMSAANEKVLLQTLAALER